MRNPLPENDVARRLEIDLSPEGQRPHLRAVSNISDFPTSGNAAGIAVDAGIG